MNTTDVINGNTTIAKFLGLSDEVVIKYNKDPKIWSCNVKYHCSWDWLMRVVQKIETMGFNVEIKGISCSVYRLCEDKALVNLVCGDRSQKFNIIYSVIVNFIEWYNKKEF